MPSGAQRVKEVRLPMPLAQTWSTRETCSVVFGWIFSLALWFMLGVWIGCAAEQESTHRLCTNYFRVKALFWCLFVANYIAYLVNALCTPTREYLSNQLEDSCKSFISGLIAKPPILWWHIQCYHYETRTRTVTDSKGHSHTETYTVRVDTYAASGNYNVPAWRDISQNIDIPMRPNLLRMRLEKEHHFADDESSNHYESSFATWVSQNRRDQYQDITSGFEISGFEDYVLSRNRDELASCNCCISSIWFYVMTLLTLNICYVHIFFCLTTPFDVLLEKEISCHPNAFSTAVYTQPELPHQCQVGMEAACSPELYGPPPGTQEYAPMYVQPEVAYYEREEASNFEPHCTPQPAKAKY